jgi:hypothetical protein
MSSLEEKAYFAERERASRKMAAETTDSSARAVHLRLADLYARRVPPDAAAEPDRT